MLRRRLMQAAQGMITDLPVETTQGRGRGARIGE
jgi:hypothetical protein